MCLCALLMMTTSACQSEESFNWSQMTAVTATATPAPEAESTALTVATEGGGAKTLLLEKGSSELGNGNSIFSSGVIFTGDDSGRLFEYLKELRGGFTGTPDAILKAFADEMIHHREWLNGLGATDEQLMHAADVAQAGDFIRSLPDGLNPFVAQGGTNFSGGQSSGFPLPGPWCKSRNCTFSTTAFQRWTLKRMRRCAKRWQKRQKMQLY